MQFKLLGKSGLLTSDLCLGTMIFGENSERSTPPAEAEKIIHRYLEAGGNHIDTANVYAGGRSEEIVGKALKSHRDQVILATKVRFPMGAGRNDEGLSRHHILQAVHASLRRLDTDYIDLLYVHAWDPLTPLQETLRTLDDLITVGKVRYLGVSNYKAWQVMKALAVSEMHGWARFVAGQYQYSLIKRDIEYEFNDLCRSEGVGLTPWGPLAGGFLSGKYKPDQRPKNPSEGRIAISSPEEEETWDRRNIERNWDILAAVAEIAEAQRATTSQVALAWLRAKNTVSSVIIGVRTLAQLEDNLGAAELKLSAADIEKLDTISALPEMYPYRFDQVYAHREA